MYILADRLKDDHVKTPWFEIKRNDQVIKLDPEDPSGSTFDYDSFDINRIERLFEFVSSDKGFDRILDWTLQNLGEEVDIEDFLTLPQYASARERAFADVEGLTQ